jgi:HK97 family phage portal protein
VRQSGLTRLERIKEAVRSYWLGPIMSSDPRARDFFGGSPTSTGVSVDEFSAMNYSAVYAAVQLISSQVGNLPLVLYKKLPGGGKTRYEAHPLYRLVHDRPNPEMSSLVWRESLQAHVLTWGNLYSEIVRNGEGRPVALWPITPDRVTPFRRGSDTPLEYRIVNGDGSDDFIAAADMIHVPGLGFNGIIGYSVIQKMRESIGLGMAAERFGGAMYGNGLAIGGVVSFKGPKPQELSDANYLASLNSKHQGVDRAHRILALYNDAKYERMNIPPNDAQFLETRQFQVDEIARWFNLPPHKLKELMRSTNNNIEHQNLEYYIDCLSPWLERWEQELCEKLISPLERNQQEIEFVADGLLRGDVTSRGEFYSKQFSIAGLKPNEMRASENRNPIDGGDDAFVALNLIPLKLAVPYYEALIDSTKAKAEADRRPPPPPPPPPGNDQNAGRAWEVLQEELATARRIAQELEDAKDRAAVESASALAREQEARKADVERLTAEATRIGLDLMNAVRDRGVVVEERDAERSRNADHAAATASMEAAAVELRAQIATLTTESEATQRELATATERIALIEADYQRVCGEKTNLEGCVTSAGLTIIALETERTELKSQAEGLSLDVVKAQRETAAAEARAAEVEVGRSEALTLAAETAIARDEALATAERAEAARVEWQQQAESLKAAAQQVDSERAQERETALQRIAALEAEGQRLIEARTHADEVNQATVTELRGQIDAVTQEMASTTAALLEAKTVIGTLEATRDSQRALLTASDEAIAAHTAVRQQLETRLAETRLAIRGTVVDAVNRLLAKETERARKAQASPEKLGAWIHTFYPIHEDFCRIALKPAVRALLIAHGSDVPVDRLLDRMVLAHISESTRQLQGVLQDSDIESLPPALERLLRRWEAERAESFADRILTEVA